MYFTLEEGVIVCPFKSMVSNRYRETFSEVPRDFGEYEKTAIFTEKKVRVRKIVHVITLLNHQ